MNFVNFSFFVQLRVPERRHTKPASHDVTSVKKRNAVVSDAPQRGCGDMCVCEKCLFAGATLLPGRAVYM